MKRHLTSEQIEAVIAGLEIEDGAQRHLENCVACRTEAAQFGELIDARRAKMVAEEPDWEASKAAVMERLSETGNALTAQRPRWLRPVLAVAAALVVAVGLGVLKPDNPADPVMGGELAVEEILAEMDELLSDDTIPGFEIIDPWLVESAVDLDYLEPTPSESVG